MKLRAGGLGGKYRADTELITWTCSASVLYTVHMITLSSAQPSVVEHLMVAAANLCEVAALFGDTARAPILAALMGGQALPGSDLAYLTRVSRPTASEHLLKLVEARLVAVTKQGRYRYYRIASPLVARMLESIIAVAAIEVPTRYQPRSIRDDALRFARTR